MRTNLKKLPFFLKARRHTGKKKNPHTQADELQGSHIKIREKYSKGYNYCT